MISIKATPIKICLTPNCNITKHTLRIGETGAGFDMRGYDLVGKTGVKSRGYVTEGLQACTGGVVLGKKLNMFHENSSIYEDSENAKQKIFPEITEKIINMAKDAKEKLNVCLFGGWGYECNRNAKEIDKSHNLFNNIALCIEEDIPEKEGLDVALTTVWGKRDSANPDTVYARENTIVLINDVFKKLFKNGKCNFNREELVDFLEKHYEEVQIPQNVEIVAEETYQPSRGFLDKLQSKV